MIHLPGEELVGGSEVRMFDLMLLKDEKAKHLLFPVYFQVGAELPGLLVWTIRDVTLKNFLVPFGVSFLHAAQCLATAELINCLFVLGYVGG